jgi:hypothetical protein
MIKNQETNPMFRNFNYIFSKTFGHMFNVSIPEMEISKQLRIEL